MKFALGEFGDWLTDLTYILDYNWQIRHPNL